MTGAALFTPPALLPGSSPPADSSAASRSRPWMMHNLEYLKVKIKFPKFDFKQKSNLISHLKKMGMVSPFDSGNADFTGIADRSEGFNLYISAIAQECTINVDEEGAEAVALTSVIMAGSAPFKEKYYFGSVNCF